jgi:hypothetical protein
MRLSILTLLALVVFMCACENEGRSDEARATVVRYLAAINGGSGDSGWAVLNGDSRDSLDRGEYDELAEAIEDAADVPQAIALIYEDDGAYEFAVTFTEPIPPGHAALFVLENEFGNSLACMPEPDVVELVVIIHPISGPGIATNGC